MWGLIGQILLSVLSGVLTVILLAQFEAGKRFLNRFLRLPINLARRLAEGGITRMTLHRSDYSVYREGSGTLRDYLNTAQHTIDIVSISLNVTQKEGSLISLFCQRIAENHNFRVRVTLLDPASPVVPLLAKSLDVEPDELEKEIRETLKKLDDCKYLLQPSAAKRLKVLVHKTLPIGSAILLDATPEKGRIQLETKLYRAPRIESFGFEVKGSSGFYKRNYTAWNRVFDDSEEWQEPVAISFRKPQPLLVDRPHGVPDRREVLETKRNDEG